jgi:Tol biopolymer transport system component
VTSTTSLTNDRERKSDPLVTDGARLYFLMPQETGWSIAEVSTAGGEPVPVISHLEDVGLADISPDGSELLIGRFGDGDVPLYALPLPPGLPHRLGDVVAHDAGWSPNGQQIVYASGNALYIAARDGSHPRRLVNLSGPAESPRWSPDGKVLRFTLDDSKTGTHALWQVGVDGSHLKPVLPGWNKAPEECCGNWTPDGRYFVFISSRGSGVNDLYALEEKTAGFRKRNLEPIQLTTGPTLFWGAVVSRDGKKLFAIGGTPLGELIRYDSASRQFQPFLSGISAIQLSFSLDRQWVAYSTYPDGTLWRSRIDGSERLQLTRAPMSTITPQWSPDGKQIAFAGQVPGQPFQIYTVSADGGIPRELTTDSRDDVYPNWLPDGSALIFGNFWNPGDAPPLLSRLALNSGRVSALEGSEDALAPQISPDGNLVAAVAATSPAHHLLLLDLKSGARTELTNIAAYHPAWSRDAKYVFFDSFGEAETAIYRVRVSDHKLERAASLKDIKRPSWGIFSSWTGLDPDDAPLALRDISTHEIYALDWQLP